MKKYCTVFVVCTNLIFSLVNSSFIVFEIRTKLYVYHCLHSFLNELYHNWITDMIFFFFASALYLFFFRFERKKFPLFAFFFHYFFFFMNRKNSSMMHLCFIFLKCFVKVIFSNSLASNVYIRKGGKKWKRKKSRDVI